MCIPLVAGIRRASDAGAFAGRVAFRARRQITKTKPSIRQDRGTGAFHRLTRRPHACPAAHTRCPAARCARLALFEPGSLRSLRGHATSLEKKEKQAARTLEVLPRGLREPDRRDGRQSRGGLEIGFEIGHRALHRLRGVFSIGILSRTALRGRCFGFSNLFLRRRHFRCELLASATSPDR